MDDHISDLSRKFYQYMAYEIGNLRAELAALTDIVKHDIVKTQDYDPLKFHEEHQAILHQYRILFRPEPQSPRAAYEIVETDSENN